jgi:hypothetical protein
MAMPENESRLLNSLGLWTMIVKPRTIKSAEFKQADCHVEDIICIQYFDASHILI